MEKKSIIAEIDKAYERVEDIIINAHFKAASQIINKLYNKSINIKYTKGVNLYFEKRILVLYYTHKNQSALAYSLYLIKIYKKNKNIKKIGRLNIIVGIIYSRLSDFHSSTYFLKQGLEIFQNAKPYDKKRIVSAYIGLAFNNMNIGDYDKAYNYVELGNSHFESNSENNTENYTSAFLYFYKIQILVKQGDIEKARKTYNNLIANKKNFSKKEKIYLKEVEVELLKFDSNKNNTEFEQLMNLILKNSIEINDKALRLRILNSLKEHYFNLGEMTLAYKYANQINKLADAEKAKQVSLVGVPSISNHLTDELEKEGDFEIYNKSELELAAKYQLNFHKNKIKSKTLDIKTIFSPSKTLSGDYIGTFSLSNDDNDYLVILADVVGKGITASYISFMLDGIIKSIIYNTDSFQLKNMINDINSILSDSLNSLGFVSLWAGIVDVRNKKLESVNAGHLPTYLLTKDNEKKELFKGCTILGMFNKLPEFESEVVNFELGDSIIAYSDGVTEAMDKNGNLYENKFMHLIDNYTKDRALNFIQHLKSDLVFFQDHSQIQDDISCVLIEFKK